MNTGPAIHLSVVIPAYNEEARVGRTLERVAAWLAGRNYAAEILVVDDGSADGTREVAERAMANSPVPFRLLALPANRGKGAAVREGVLAARGEFILFSDADLSTPIEEADRLLARQREAGADVVLGSRALPDSRWRGSFSPGWPRSGSPSTWRSFTGRYAAGSRCSRCRWSGPTIAAVASASSATPPGWRWHWCGSAAAATDALTFFAQTHFAEF
jgi:glycosyltransferase involved in cell wall biosynthesis